MPTKDPQALYGWEANSLAKAVMQTAFQVDAENFSEIRYECRHCGYTVTDGQSIANMKHYDNCPYLIAKRYLEGK